MYFDVDAFADELQKIADERELVTRENLARAAGGALIAGGGFGLGYGLGNLAIRKGLPAKIGPLRSPVATGLAGAGLGYLSSMALANLRKEYQDYIRGGQEQDMLMGHTKLNPETDHE